jgi:hypothetical protein
VWNEQYATVDLVNVALSNTGFNHASAEGSNEVGIGQEASADAFLETTSRDEIIPWVMSEGFAEWNGFDGPFQVIPGTPLLVPVLGGTATNLVGDITNAADGIAEITTGAATSANSTTGAITQAFSSPADATATAGGSVATASAESRNLQDVSVGVTNVAVSNSGFNSAHTSGSNSVGIGQSASANAGASVNGNAGDDPGSGEVTGGSASNTVNSVSNTANGQASVTTGNATSSNANNITVNQSNTGSGATSTATAGGSGGAAGGG